MSTSSAFAKRIGQSTIADNKVVLFSKSYCPYCRRAKSLFASEFPNTEVTVVEYVSLQHGRLMSR